MLNIKTCPVPRSSAPTPMAYKPRAIAPGASVFLSATPAPVAHELEKEEEDLLATPEK
jgi:hypothetical protein